MCLERVRDFSTIEFTCRSMYTLKTTRIFLCQKRVGLDGYMSTIVTDWQRIQVGMTDWPQKKPVEEQNAAYSLV